MKFKGFTHKGSFWKKVSLFIQYKLGFIYLANITAHVPYHTQQVSPKTWKRLKDGTKCYLAEFDVMLELQGERWFALGNSKNAKQLNGEIDAWVKLAEETTPSEIFEEIKRFTKSGTDSLEERILADEARRVKLFDPKLNN